MRALFALTLAMLLASSALAQTTAKQHELFFTVGDAGPIFAIEDIAIGVITLGSVTYGDQEGGLQIAGGYQHHFGRWTSAGVTAAWAGSKKSAYVLGTRRGNVERRLLTFMVDGRAHWLRRPSVDLYSGLMLGVIQLADDLDSLPGDDSETGPGFHVTALGIRVGRGVGGLIEIGAGFNGFLKAGLSGRF